MHAAAPVECCCGTSVSITPQRGWQETEGGQGAFALTSIAALLPPLLLMLGPRWAASVALGVGLGAALLRLLYLRCIPNAEGRPPAH